MKPNSSASTYNNGKNSKDKATNVGSLTPVSIATFGDESNRANSVSVGAAGKATVCSVASEATCTTAGGRLGSLAQARQGGQEAEPALQGPCLRSAPTQPNRTRGKS